ncbi:iron chelate uptake ABC transporter family permease subunit [Vagococcus silagei]|uniref:Uncharacterized protein n=1 Tax=Vagococcus silagei TaxID=2508885 RepID=A0A4S3B032_9ENTE|nr:hypothetical protein ESZ54_12135 [Vagococcus silagei]
MCLTRTLAAIAVVSSLVVCGAFMQSLLRNELRNLGTLRMSSGLFVCLYITILISSAYTSVPILLFNWRDDRGYYYFFQVDHKERKISSTDDYATHGIET